MPTAMYEEAGHLWRALAVRLDRAGIPSPMLDARLLLCHAAGWPPDDLIRFSDRPVSSPAARRLEILEQARLSGMPVARLLGRREFWSLEFDITPATFVPRPDSETLVQACLDVIAPDAPARLLDLGCGSGCLLLSILAERPGARGLGVDRHAGAVHTARRNAVRLGCGARALFCVADWTAPLTGAFDVVLSNPPYIPTGDIKALPPEVRLHDPVAALDGGPDGLAAYRRITSGAMRLLAPGGWLALEAGVRQAQQIRALMINAGLENTALIRDLAGIHRVVVGQWLPSVPAGGAGRA